MNIAATIASRTGLPVKGVTTALELMADGATIPFISRYRKEATGSLDDIQLFEIQQLNIQLTELDKRKETVVSTIETAGRMTDDLRQRIDEASTMSQLEDLYLPYKPKRRTRATIARERGLEPLAKMLMSRGLNTSPSEAARRFVKGDITDTDQALEGAQDIIAEWVSESESARKQIRNLFNRTATINAILVKGKEEDRQYSDYHNYTSELRRCPSHRYLAMRRAENEGILRISIDIDRDNALDRLDRIFLNNIQPQATDTVAYAIADGYKRLLKPSIENETAADAKERADKEAIDIFSDNLRQLLMAAPLGHKRVMGIDPGFRTGCKVVCLDAGGNLKHHTVIYPTAPRNDTEGAGRIVRQLVDRYAIDAISIGNGTASRETERFVKNIKWGDRTPDVHVVNEAGASVYSASEVARREFPDEDVTVRGAVSIARRLIDPMAELVKIDPKSIGVGQYQHDVDQSALKTSLDHTVESCVNSVGINLNTASPELLSYVSGIGPKLAGAIVEYRSSNGPFKSRAELMDVPRLGKKVYTLAAGFLRLPESSNQLDNTAVHPESYHIVERMAKDNNCSIDELIKSAEKRAKIDLNRYVTETTGLPTLTDIMEELSRPGRDPRGEARGIEFDDSINDIGDLRTGMILPGIVNNITAFGAFVDLGIHHSGLIHLSQLSDRYITHPSQAVRLGQHVMVKVMDIDLTRQRISLSMKGVKQ